MTLLLYFCGIIVLYSYCCFTQMVIAGFHLFVKEK